MSLLSNVKSLAKKRGLSIEQVAKQASELNNDVNISRSSLYKWDDHEPKPSAVKAVADVLGVSVDYLLGNTDDIHPKSQPISDAELEAAFESAESFDGKPMTDHDKQIIKGLIISYLTNKE